MIAAVGATMWTRPATIVACPKAGGQLRRLQDGRRGLLQDGRRGLVEDRHAVRSRGGQLLEDRGGGLVDLPKSVGIPTDIVNEVVSLATSEFAGSAGWAASTPVSITVTTPPPVASPLGIRHANEAGRWLVDVGVGDSCPAVVRNRCLRGECFEDRGRRLRQAQRGRRRGQRYGGGRFGQRKAAVDLEALGQRIRRHQRFERRVLGRRLGVGRDDADLSVPC